MQQSRLLPHPKKLLTSIGLLLVVLFSSTMTFGQNRVPNIHKPGDIIVKWSPTSLLDGYPSIQFSGEYFYDSLKSVQLEYGLMVPLLEGYFGRYHLHGHRIRLSNRFYFTDKKHRANFYLAPQLQFNWINYDNHKQFALQWYPQSPGPGGQTGPIGEYTGTIGIRKLVYALNFMMGYQYIGRRSHISVDVSWGFGLRLLSNIYTSYPTVGTMAPHRLEFGNLASPKKEGTLISPNLVLGFKIGYQLGK